MGFFQDMAAVFKKRQLPFLEQRKESEKVYSFLFEKDKDLNWKAGQHGLFTITHKKIKNGTKPFTIASAPSENVVQLTVRIKDEPSDFKAAMLELKQGMNITMSGPLGSFHLTDDQRPAVMIAGGIGITPFRSILKQVEAEGGQREHPIHLLYLDSNQAFVFKDMLDEIAKIPSIDVAYLASKDDLQQKIDQFTGLYQDNGDYFIAGPQSMTNAISNDLKAKVSKRNIKKDAFYGYD